MGIWCNFTLPNYNQPCMKPMYRLLWVVAFCFYFSSLFAQQTSVNDTASYPYWIEMMQDERVNLNDVNRAFELYWQNRPITKGSGYKPYKRWEYNMRNGKVYADGTRKPQDLNWNAYQDLKTSKRLSTAGNWVSKGPVYYSNGGYKGLGRINALGFDPVDQNTLYIGAPAGGLWKTTDGGVSWQSLTDSLPTLGVSAIAIHPTNTSTIYIGTGDRDAGDAVGMGVMRTTDGGINWELWNTGMGTKTVHRLLMHPTDPTKLYASTSGGIYTSTDGGANWVLSTSGNFKELVMKPNDPTTFYASKDGNFYRSTNGAATFTQVTTGLTSAQRGVIAVSPASPTTVYFLQSKNDSGFKGLYRSTDSGSSFQTMSTSPNIMDWSCDGSGSGGQAWYDLELAADPTNASVIFSGGVNVWKSSNGGQTWQIVGHWYGGCNVEEVHADQHVFEYSPLNNILFVGNDGGIYKSPDQGQTFSELSNGLVISQIYKIGQDVHDTLHTIIGMQDNGTSTTMAGVWKDTHGGDGMECIIDYANPYYSYATVYYGDITRHFNNGADYTIASNGMFGIDEEGDWVTPYTLHVTDPTKMFIGYKNIWRGFGIRGNPTWTKISDNLAGNNSTNMRVVEQSKANPDVFYAARWDKKLFRSDNVNDNTVNWTSVPIPVNETPSAIRPHPFDENVVYMALDGKIYKSTNKGALWEDISGSLPEIEYTSIAYYENAHEGLYVSSDIGVFYKDSTMSDWVNFSQNLPIDASIREVEICYNTTNNEQDRITAGTFGRGTWMSPMWRDVPVAAFSSDVTTIPTAGSIHFQDLSAGVPSSWLWTFEGGTPATSTSKNPIITYSNPGTFNVSLTVTNSSGTNTIAIEDYITVSSTLLPVAGFYASNTTPCSGEVVVFTDTTQFSPVSWNWQFSPNTIAFVNGTSATSQNPEVVFNTNGSYHVTLTATNPNGDNTIVRNNYIRAGGYVIPFEEDFESGLNAKSWTVNNPDNEITWDVREVNGNAPGSKAAYMNLFVYYKMNQRDQLISPSLNFEGFDKVSLSFEHAYAQRFNQRDSLIVYTSFDCGATWKRVFASAPNGSGIFETAPTTSDEFIPTVADDWCGNGWGASCIELNLSDLAGRPDCKIMFETYNKLGNNLYIDNVFVSNYGVGIGETNETGFRVSPNPSEGSFTLEWSGSTDATISLFTAAGQKVYSTQAKSQYFVENVALKGLSSGLYFFKIETKSKAWYQKMIIK